MRVFIAVILVSSVSSFNEDRLVSVISKDRFNAAPAVPAKTYVVNLDLPPMERWNNALKHFNPSDIVNAVRTLMREYIPPEAIPLLEKVAADLDRYVPQPFADELRGISKTFDVDLGDVVLGNLVYDISAFNSSGINACTSIVARDRTGKIIHGRNLDYAVGEILKPLTIQVAYQRNGKTLFMATTYAGYIGVITGTRPGAFSVSGDERNTGRLMANLLSALEGSLPTFFLQRMVLETAIDYTSALTMFIRSPTIAPVYFIVGGMKEGEGSVIVDDQRNLRNITMMDKNWYILETNYDSWKPAPPSDDRRDAAIAAMNKVGEENMDVDQLYKVLSVSLVFNSHTTYTTIMSAADDSVYHTMIRYDAPLPPTD